MLPSLTTSDINIDHLAEEEFAKFPLAIVNFYFLPFPYYFLWKEITKHSPQMKFVHKLPGILLSERYMSLLPCLLIYSIIYLSQYGFMDIYFIFRFKSNAYVIHFVAQIVLPSLWKLFLLALVSLWHIYTTSVFFFKLPYYLALYYSPDSSYVFAVHALETAIALRMPGFFY